MPLNTRKINTFLWPNIINKICRIIIIKTTTNIAVNYYKVILTIIKPKFLKIFLFTF